MLIVNQKNIQQNTHPIHRLFIMRRKYRKIVLASALVIWSVIPIVGIVFLLLYCQINLSNKQIRTKEKPFLNLIPILLIIFTISIYIATFKTFNDTDTYIEWYAALGRESPFTFPNIDAEPGAFILPKYVSWITQGNTLMFLLLQSLTMNIAFTVYSIIFVPEFYPLIILINVMSQGYYFQLFWMRQLYSFIFIIPAVYTNIFALRWFLVSLGFFTHGASLIYAFTFTVTLIKNAWNNYYCKIKKSLKIDDEIKDPKFLILISFVGIVVFFGFFLEHLLQMVGIVSILTGDSVADRVNTYSTDDTNMALFSLASQLRTILDYVTISIFAIATDYSKPNPILSRWLLLFVTVLGLYIGSFVSGFNLRVASLFFCLPGFFYTIPLLSGKLDGEASHKKSNIYVYILFGSIALRIFYFFNNLVNSYETENYLTFWDGHTLTTPITGYVEFFLKCFTSNA